MRLRHLGLMFVCSFLSLAVLAENTQLPRASLDLSRLTKTEQGNAITTICLEQCLINYNSNYRFEQKRYDRYYDTAGDSSRPNCTRLSCESSATAAVIRDICDTRYSNFEDFAVCALKCKAVSASYGSTILENSEFKTYVERGVSQSCARVNRSPFRDYDDSCPEILFTDEEDVDCSLYDNILESKLESSRLKSIGVNLKDHTIKSQKSDSPND